MDIKQLHLQYNLAFFDLLYNGQFKSHRVIALSALNPSPHLTLLLQDQKVSTLFRTGQEKDIKLSEAVNLYFNKNGLSRYHTHINIKF